MQRAYFEKRGGAFSHEKSRSLLLLNPPPFFPPYNQEKAPCQQEQTMFDDQRRGLTDDRQRLTKFKTILLKSTRKISDFASWAFLTFKMTLKVKFDPIRPP